MFVDFEYPSVPRLVDEGNGYSALRFLQMPQSFALAKDSGDKPTEYL